MLGLPQTPTLEAAGTGLGSGLWARDLWRRVAFLGPSSLLCVWDRRKGGRLAGGQWAGLTISMPFFFMRRQDLRYVRMRLRARSWNSGNCRLQDSMMAWIFSLGCLEMGTMRSKFSSTKSRTNICGRQGLWRGPAVAVDPALHIPRRCSH